MFVEPLLSFKFSSIVLIYGSTKRLPLTFEKSTTLVVFKFYVLEYTTWFVREFPSKDCKDS